MQYQLYVADLNRVNNAGIWAFDLLVDGEAGRFVRDFFQIACESFYDCMCDGLTKDAMVALYHLAQEVPSCRRTSIQVYTNRTLQNFCDDVSKHVVPLSEASPEVKATYDRWVKMMPVLFIPHGIAATQRLRRRKHIGDAKPDVVDFECRRVTRKDDLKDKR